MDASTMIVGPDFTRGGDGEQRNQPRNVDGLSWEQAFGFGSGLGGGAGWESLSSVTTAANLPTVTARTSLTLPAVWRCVMVIAQSIARMPLKVYRWDESGGRIEADQHPAYRVLHGRWNPLASPYTGLMTMMVNYLLHGRAYAHIEWSGDGRRLRHLWPIEASRVTKRVDADGVVTFDVATSQGRVELASYEMVELMWATIDGVTALSPIGFARVTLGGAMASRDFEAGLAANNMRPSGVLTNPGKMTEMQLKTQRDAWAKQYFGASNGGYPIILDNGATFQPITLPFEDAQFIERAHLSIEDICRIFGVMPSVIGHSINAKYATAEAEMQAFLAQTLLPIVRAIEQELDYKLFSNVERVSYYTKFTPGAVVQLDVRTQMEMLTRGIGSGIYSLDEARSLVERNNLPQGRGSVHYVPANLMPAATPQIADRLLEAMVQGKGGTGAGGGGEGGSSGGDAAPPQDGGGDNAGGTQGDAAGPSV